MARKVVPLANFDNLNQLIDYIQARIPIYSEARVTKLVQLAGEAKVLHRKLELDFEEQYNVFVHEPKTHSEEHKKSLLKIEVAAFENLNDCIEETQKLKPAFRNAQAQKRHKDKVKFTDDDRVVMEVSYKERVALYRLRDLCKEKGVDFRTEINDCAYLVKLYDQRI